MKVNVTRKARPIQWEVEFEKLFQENKDLRVYVGHLRDELNLVQQQSEVRRQKMAEKDALIDELNDQITAQEEELKEASKHSARLAEVCAQRDNYEASYKQVCEWWGKEQARAEEYHIALIERDCQIEELEEQLKQVRNEKKAMEDVIHAFEETRKEYEEEIHTQHVEKREWMQKYEELKAQKEADDKKCEETCTACNKLYEDVLSERNHLREEVTQLTSKLKTLQNAYELQKENADFNYDTLLAHTKDLECKVVRYTQTINQQEDRIAELESALNEARANLENAADADSNDGELEEQLDYYKKAASIWQEKAEAIQECREDAEAELRDVSNRFIQMYQEKMDNEKEAREVIAGLRDELNDRNARVEELEKKIEWLQTERQLYEKNIARLTNERDTAVCENTHLENKIEELMEEHNELEADYDALAQTKRDYAEEIDRLRKVVTHLQSTRFTTDEFIRMIARELVPSTDK